MRAPSVGVVVADERSDREAPGGGVLDVERRRDHEARGERPLAGKGRGDGESAALRAQTPGQIHRERRGLAVVTGGVLCLAGDDAGGSENGAEGDGTQRREKGCHRALRRLVWVKSLSWSPVRKR